MFQSRNRETYDSNHSINVRIIQLIIIRFNLVIEKLMIPTRRLECYRRRCKRGKFQSRNRETYDSNASQKDIDWDFGGYVSIS